MKTHFKKVFKYIRSFTWFLTNCPIVNQATHKERVKLLNIITVKFKEVSTKMMQKYEKDKSFFSVVKEEWHAPQNESKPERR